MTLLEQLLSPAVMEWTKANRHLSKEQKINEFDKWFANNVESINESVKNNIDHINERLENGLKNAKLLVENADDDFDWGIDAEDDNGEDENTDDNDSNYADTSAADVIEDDDVDITISKKYVLTNSFKNPKTNVFACVNAFYNEMEENGISRDDNPHIWGRLDVKKVTNMTALFAFADIANADLSSWDTSNVILMEGMFYKSTFNNNSISRWNVGSCENFLRMFTFCDFSGDITHWNLKEIEVPQIDNLGNTVKINGKTKMIKTTVNPPLIGANANEELERVNKFWGGVLKGFIDDKDKKNIQEENKTMKHILDYETFIINEGLGDVFKKGFNKIKSFFKNATMKFGNFIASFNDKGEIMNASDPYTALNYIADGKVEGVSAYTDVKNEFLNDNVKSTARLIENPEYYGIIDKNSIEYQNYLTMVEMVNEHYSKYGDKLNEANGSRSERVGFSAESGGLTDAVNITSEELLDEIDDIILNTPYEKGEDASKPILIWGAPGIGKSTIPNAVIKAWNSKSAKKKTLMVVECGNLTVDGFALPMPTTKTIGQYMKERPEAAQNIIDQIGDIEKAISEIDIQLSDDVVKKWVPVYRETANKAENIAQNEIANGGRISEYVKDEKTGKFRKETIETTEGGLLLFDEFFRANPQVFKILMQLLLNRRFNNDFVLGDKWAMMACSNRPNDDEEVSNGFETTGAVIGTRFKDQYNFIPDFDEWKKWAVKDGHFDEGTLSFLVLKKDPTTGEYINWHTIRPNEYTKGKTGWPTPRTWSGLMSDLHNYMTNHNYSSIIQIPDRVIERKAGGAIGRKLGLEYTEYIKKYYSNFNPADILNKSDYTISDDMTPSEVFDRLGTYIDSTFDKTNPPSDNQMMNMFNTLERTFDGGKGNYAKVLYTSALEKFGIHDADATDRILKIFPNFIVAIAKKYKLLAMVKVDGKIKPDTNFTIENIQDFCNGDEPKHK